MYTYTEGLYKYNRRPVLEEFSMINIIILRQHLMKARIKWMTINDLGEPGGNREKHFEGFPPRKINFKGPFPRKVLSKGQKI